LRKTDIPKKVNPLTLLEKSLQIPKNPNNHEIQEHWANVYKKRQSKPRFKNFWKVLEAIAGKGDFAIPLCCIKDTTMEFGEEVNWPESGGTHPFKAYLHALLIGSEAEIPPDGYSPCPPGKKIKVTELPYLENLWDQLKTFSGSPILPFLEFQAMTGLTLTQIAEDVPFFTDKKRYLFIKFTFFPYNREMIENGYTVDHYICATKFKIENISDFKHLIDSTSAVDEKSLRQRRLLSKKRDEEDRALIDLHQAPQNEPEADAEDNATLPVPRYHLRNRVVYIDPH